MLSDPDQVWNPAARKDQPRRVTIQIMMFTAVSIGIVGIRWAVPGLTPTKAAAAYLDAIAAGDLGALDGLSEVPLAAQFAARLAEEEATGVQEVRKKVAEHGEDAWLATRVRVEVACGAFLARLRDKANEAGRVEYERLSVADRMALITDRARYATFIATAGLPALPEQERQLLQAATSAGDLAVFVDSHGLACSPQEARPGVTNQAALSRKPSAERTACVESLGRSGLDSTETLILDSAAEPTPAGLTRGEFLAKKRLLTLDLRRISVDCSVQRLKRGALLPSRAPDWRQPEGARAGCTASIVLAGQKAQPQLALVRQRGQWKVKGENPFEWTGGVR